MKVFKACIRIMKRRKASFLVYLIVFLALVVAMTSFSVDRYTTDFETNRPEFTFINRDKEGPMLTGFYQYLLKYGEEVPLEDDQKSLQDAAFFQASSYIVIVPEGFTETVFSDHPIPLQKTTFPDSAKGYYLDSLVNQYWNQLRMIQGAAPGLSEEELVQKASESLAKTAEAELFREEGAAPPVPEVYQLYFQMQGYILIVLVLLGISTVLMVFHRPYIRLRNMCSPMPSEKITVQMTLYGIVISIIAWLILTVFGFLIWGRSLSGVDVRQILLLCGNSLMFTLTSAAIAVLASCFIHVPNLQNAVANFLSLGLCFLGGVFVPLELFGEGMLKIARFTPTYWYTSAIKEICTVTDFTTARLEPIWQAMGIQFGFAAALFLVTLAVQKQKNATEKGFGQSRTEYEA
ncbi:ABC transporter permease [Hominifimenecus sp. rT4P-3]|uniref:ABC transporter permease n=1 Tax=Hominifimenecus sp. rT4P-3 TaxID=3242979 RepID=UPI003DA242D6